MSLVDATLICRDCGRQVVFASREPEFYPRRGPTNDPVRRPERRAARVQQAVGYADGSESAGIGGGYGQPDHQRRQTFAAVCRSCGKEAQVPIQTRGDQPVYCSDCFGSGWGSRGA